MFVTNKQFEHLKVKIVYTHTVTVQFRKALPVQIRIRSKQDAVSQHCIGQESQLKKKGFIFLSRSKPRVRNFLVDS